MSRLTPLVERLQRAYPNATLTLSGPPRAPIVASTRVDVALEEVIENSLEHTGSAPHVSVSVQHGDETTTVEITDDGPGLPEMERDVLSGAENETEIAHGGGLGLWLVYLIARRSRASVDVRSDGEHGTTVKLAFRSEGDATAAHGAAPHK